MLQTELGRVESVLMTLEQKRPEVAAHSRRVSAYSVRFASQFGFEPRELETIRVGALLHDVGKLLIPSRILTKPGRPNAREWRELKIHPELGMEIAHRCGFDDEVCHIVLYHHERYDGSGYPDGLAKDQIDFKVRIVNVMDTLDALTSARDYRERLTFEAARALIVRGVGTHHCPWVVTGLMAMPPEMFTIPVPDGRVADSHPEMPGFIPALDQMTQSWQSPAALCAC